MAGKPGRTTGRRMKESPSQTAGPYVHIGLTPKFVGIRNVYEGDLGASNGAAGSNVITISGTVFDGAGEPVRDCLLEFQQADARGNLALAPVSRNQTGFTGFSRIPVDLKTGAFRLETVKPGAICAADGSVQAPHVTVWLVARGINIGLHTRLYFADEAEANAADPVLALVPPRRRATLMASREAPNRYHFDIHLQGEGETVFFDV